MHRSYDVVVAGGSIAGLLCAREIALRGFSVVVIEMEHEIGTPEHCGGLVSDTGLARLNVSLSDVSHTEWIKQARITSPGGHGITINAQKQKVIGINRRDLDKHLAFQAQKNGATIMVRTALQKVTNTGVKTTQGDINCKIVVDARGVSSMVSRDKAGVIPSAQYEVYADWIDKETVEVIFDNKKYPGFFAWVIPLGLGHGKVGVAGRGIDVVDAIDTLLDHKDYDSLYNTNDLHSAQDDTSAQNGVLLPTDKNHMYSTVRKIFAPIWVGGPISDFVINDKIVIVGDAAGQAKPTTAGGIYSSGLGGILAGKAISKFLETRNKADLLAYQKEWTAIFGKEFEKQLVARRVLERIDNKAIDSILRGIPPNILRGISESDDFDFHTRAILKMLGVKGSARTARAMIGSELRRILS